MSFGYRTKTLNSGENATNFHMGKKNVCHATQEQEAYRLSRLRLLFFLSLHTVIPNSSLLEMISLSQVAHKLSRPCPCMVGLRASCCLSVGFPALKRSKMCLSDTFLSFSIMIKPAIRYSHLPSSLSLSSFLSLCVKQTPPFIRC